MIISGDKEPMRIAVKRILLEIANDPSVDSTSRVRALELLLIFNLD
jgi:hypothetical protein